MKLRYIKYIIIFAGLTVAASCKKYFDINKDPDRLPSSTQLYPQLLTSAQVNIGFEGGSDLYRYTTLMAQHMSGQASSPNQTYDYDRYNITGNDQNNVWGTMFSGTLADIELIIKQGATAGAPHYSGVAKMLKAYEYVKIVDTWGDVPFSEAQQLDQNTAPKYDNDEAIYPALITLLNEGIVEVNAGTSIQSPGTNSVIYPGAWATTKNNWIKFANTLKLRIYIHYSKKNPAFSVSQITALVNTAGITFMASNADNFQMNFFSAAGQQNPITQFEVNRPDYLFASDFMINLMNGKSDPRRFAYFTPFPWGSTSFLGTKAGDPVSINYSRIYTYLRGAATGTPSIAAGTLNAQGGITRSALTYTGAVPVRMLTYAEYCFIRSEAALMGAPGSAQQFFTDGITASLTEAGVSAANITAYLTANGTLTGTPAQQLKQIIEEKYVASFGVTVEPWTDWRRTGYPLLIPHSNGVISQIPRSFFYPQSEIDYNPNSPGQKPADLQTKVFWDN